MVHSPTENAQHQVEDKEGAKDDKTDKVDPGQLVTHGILHLPAWGEGDVVRGCRTQECMGMRDPGVPGVLGAAGPRSLGVFCTRRPQSLGFKREGRDPQGTQVSKGVVP